MLPALRNPATLTPWTVGPTNRIDGFFDRLFGEDGLVSQVWGAVPVAMWQDEDHLYVEAELPGVAEKDVDITVHNGMLFIRGERRPEEGRNYLYNGRSFGRFERIVTLPEAVDIDAVRAELADGMLRITLPKSPEAKPKKSALTTA
jgi:HSP20 family protein